MNIGNSKYELLKAYKELLDARIACIERENLARMSELKQISAKMEQLIADICEDDSEEPDESADSEEFLNETLELDELFTDESASKLEVGNAVEGVDTPETQTVTGNVGDMPLHDQIKYKHQSKLAMKREKRERKEAKAEEKVRQETVSPIPQTLVELIEQKGSKAEFLMDISAILKCPMETLQRYKKQLWVAKYSLNSALGICTNFEAKAREEVYEKVNFFMNGGNVMDIKVSGDDLLGNVDIKMSHRIQGGGASIFIASNEESRYFLVGSSTLRDVCLDNGLKEAQVLYYA